MQLNEAQDIYARQALHSLSKLSSTYTSEDIKLKETLQVLDIQKEQLPKSTQQIVSQLSELAVVLGVADTTLATFHQGIAQSQIERIHWSTLLQQDHHSVLHGLDQHQTEALQSLKEAQILQQKLKVHRSTAGDIELRTRRRSAELARIKAKEDTNQLESLIKIQQQSGLDVEDRGLTVAQLDLRETEVTELEKQVNVQTKSLTAYQEIPPDFALARLKVKEGMLRLDELTAEHEVLVRELADDL
ncbi:hypothetical protein FBU30_000265 [Linnemannia zychae]|nr:hypothetical protein FBU30_000265 [Linnemannia zychae]